MIKSYCHQDIERGIFLLKLASKRGCARSSYTLGLILRDTDPEEASIQMNIAAKKGYMPALQELLSAREMKARFGEPDAAALRNHLDPYCLNRLLGRHYIHSSHLRDVNTSHCWNPLCGRWAYKATSANSENGVTTRAARRPFALNFHNHPLLIIHRIREWRVVSPPRDIAESPNRVARRARAAQRRVISARSGTECGWSCQRRALGCSCFEDENVQSLLPCQVLQQALPGLRLEVWSTQDGVSVSLVDRVWLVIAYKRVGG